MANTIILQKGCSRLTNEEYKKFENGDTIYGNNSNPEEVKRWSMDEEEVAKEALSKLNCKYTKLSQLWDIEEYALEYCECDEAGEFISGSDYEMAEEF